MPMTVTFLIEGISPLSQSAPHETAYLPGESHDDYKQRTWREHLHVDKNDNVFIPPSAIKNCISDAAKFMNIGIPGKGKATYTKHVEAGIAVVEPVLIGVKKADVAVEKLFLPADGRRGSGKRVWKYYPRIDVWGGPVQLVILDETVLQTSRGSGNPVLQDIVEGAGQYIGLHRYRPRMNGYYGRFSVHDFAIQSMSMAAE